MNLTLCAAKIPVHLNVVIFAVLLSTVFSCKTREATNSISDPVQKETSAPAQQVAADSLYCLTQQALYQDLLSKNQWQTAIHPWRNAFQKCPLMGQNFYIDGGNIYRYYIKNTTDSLRKESYIDTLMMLYDRRIALFENSGFVEGRKGLDLLNFRPRDKQAAWECLLTALEREKNGTQTAVMQALVVTAIDLNREGTLDTSMVLNTYAKVKDVIYYNLRENIKDTLLYFQVSRDIDKVFLPWADCKLLTTTYKDRIARASVEELENIVHIFELIKCFDYRVFREATERLYQLQPSPKTAFYQGLNAYSQQQYEPALNYFRQAAEQFTEPVNKASSLVSAGRTYEALRQYEPARDMARKALAADPKCGAAYLLIGDLYTAAARSCGNGDQLTEEAVYWAANDQYRLAAQVDPTVRDEAVEKQAACRRRYPLKKLLFFHQLQVGESYTVGCWIQEKTIIRARPE